MTDDTVDTSSLSPLKRAFLALEESRARVAELEAAAREPIAIIGLGCRLPGGVDGPESYWNLLKNGVDAIGPIPSGRWDVEALFDADPEAPGRIATRAGAFLENVDAFDPTFFGITRREAQGMDPQQRLFLEVCWEALEHAGHAPDGLERSATGIYVGVTGNDYAYLQLETRQRDLLDAHFASGIAHSVASGRISYLLGLHGPSLTIDTACSSSLVALHLAVQGLRTGDCRMALAGGVNLILSPDVFIALSHSRMLAPDGRCKTFDASADGFARGEGCGVVVLKRLSDAIADRDRVLAVIRSTAVNQDGPSSGLTAPNGPQQESVVRQALARADVAPREVSYIETHGTGTQLGDPLEVHALGAVFGGDRDAEHPLLIGSVKTNIGHVEAAAGVAGLIKLVLSLRHREIPAHLHFTTPSPHISWDEFPIRVPTVATPWNAIDGRRIAGLSSFGFSGTNAHVIVEEAPAMARPDLPGRDPQRAHLFVLSARDGKSLAAVARRYANAFAVFGDGDLPSVCYSAAVAKAHHPERAAIMARSMDELRELLEVLAQGGTAEGIRTERVSRRDPARIAFLYTGQGAQYAGMARALYETESVFRTAMDRCAAIADPLLPYPLLGVVFADDPATSPIDETGYSQPALFALEYAVTELWRAWGVTPTIVLGHSIGEIAAACVAGVMSVEDGMKLVANRGRLMQALPPGGAMAAIHAPEATVAVEIAAHKRMLSIAAINAPGQTVISGAADVVDAVCGTLMRRGVRCTRLRVSHAFHSPLLEPMLDAFERVADTVAYSAPRLKLISNVTGRVADAAEVTTARYWRQHVREAVRFADGAKTLDALAPDICVEVGPHATLLPLLEESSGGKERTLVATLRKGRADQEQLADALGALFLAGVPLDWRAVWKDAAVELVDLPSYPFERERCWFPQRTPGAAEVAPAARVHGEHPFVGARVRSPLADVAQFESTMHGDSIAFVRDHRVGDRIIMPGTGFIEMGLAAALEVFGEVRMLREVVIADALAFDDGEARTVHVAVRNVGDGSFSVHSSSAREPDVWTLHAQGDYTPTPDPVAHEHANVVMARCGEVVTADAHYRDLAARGLDFGPSLRGIVEVHRRDGEAIAQVTLPPDTESAPYVINPALLDACVQAVSQALPKNIAGRRYLPLAIGSIAVHRAAGTTVWSHAQLHDQAGRDGSLTADVVVSDREGVVAEIRGLRLRLDTRQSDALRDSLYEITWIEEGGAWIPLPASLSSQVGGNLERHARANNLDEYNGAFLALESLSVAWITAALKKLGWDPRIGDRFTAAELNERLRIIPRFHRLIGRFLAILDQEGIVTRADAGWIVSALPPARDVSAELPAIIARHPSSHARLALASGTGHALADILAGTADPLDSLFPGGSAALAESLYRDAPESKVFGALTRDTMEAIAAQLPHGRRLRILEVGGGTGGTTAQVISALPQDRTEYTFTDVGPTLVARARETFAQHPSMTFSTFDLERDAGEQGFRAASYDVIIASNVIHATADLRKTLASIRGLLAPGGVLLMLEVAGFERWIDITFGLTDGWWRFTDADLRPDYPLLSRSEWLSLLRSLGFDATTIGHEISSSREVLLIARAPEELPLDGAGQWLILADTQGVGDGLARRLKDAGQIGTILRRINKSGGAVSNAVVRKVVEQHSAVRGIIDLWSLEINPRDDGDPEDLRGMQRTGIGSVLAAVQGIGATSYSAGATPRLWIVTRDAAPVGDLALQNVAQAPASGMRRSIAIEHPELRATCVDLDGTTSVDEQSAALFAAMTARSDERDVALRGDKRFVPRLSHVPASAPRANERLEKSAQGVLDDVALKPVARRTPGPGEVEIQVRAAGLNFRDVMNALAMRDDPEPLGGECAGRVTRVGEGVTGIAVGDDVVAIAEAAFATYAVADAPNVAPLPAGMTYAEGATLPFAFMTAYHALVELGDLQRGETVLVHAGAGGVGLAAIQIAKHAGTTVIATAGSDAKRAYLRSIGVEHVFNSRDVGFEADVAQVTGARGVNLVLNSLAGDFIPASVRALAANGRFLEIGKRDIWTNAQFAEHRPAGKYFAIDLAAMRVEAPFHSHTLFARVMRDAGIGTYRPLPIHPFPMANGADAFRFMAQARQTGKIVLVAAQGGHILDEIAPRGVYLVTGGLSGLGLLTATTLALRGARALVLVGRRAPTAEALEAIGQMEQDGVTVRVEQADVSSPAEVRRVLDVVRSTNLPLRGIVHSAGVLADGALTQQTWDRFVEPLGPKINGSWALHSLTKHIDLDFFVLFSSIASVIGSAGQANHAAANAFMDALATLRRGMGLPAHSISWGAWSDIGAAADRQMDARISERGMGSISPGDGLRLLEAILGGSAPHVAAFHVDWHRFFETHPVLALSPYFDNVRSRTPRAGSAGRKKQDPAPTRETIPARHSLIEEIRGASPARRAEMLISFVNGHVARVVGAPDAESMDPTQPLNEMGLDSLMAVELRNRLGAGLGLARSLPATLVFDYPTLNALAEYLARELVPESSGAPTADVARASVGALSDEQVDELFANRTRKR